MIGFVYSEELSDYDHAEREFKALVDRYPSSELVKSAKWMMENMRKGTPNFELPDSIIKSMPVPGSAPGTKGK